MQGCVAQAAFQEPFNKRSPALVRPQAGQGKPNKIAKGHTVPNISCIGIAYKIRISIAYRMRYKSLRISDKIPRIFM